MPTRLLVVDEACEHTSATTDKPTAIRNAAAIAKAHKHGKEIWDKTVRLKNQKGIVAKLGEQFGTINESVEEFDAKKMTKYEWNKCTPIQFMGLNTASNDGKEGGESERHLTPPLLASRLNSVKANGVERSKALSRVLSQHWDHRDTPRNFWSQFFGRTEPLHMSGTTWLKSLRSPQ
ncbi:hypothetical protein Tcan_03496 [Toxocara canis]|uniref:Uncharacterized protein n=1 Tax=Toxocara canis TaxID=6265 RepID=A0A0B2VJJ6_TOXCA|nr:hypothetical protein Tcan_03496 [Toxocara canis]